MAGQGASGRRDSGVVGKCEVGTAHRVAAAWEASEGGKAHSLTGRGKAGPSQASLGVVVARSGLAWREWKVKKQVLVRIVIELRGEMLAESLINCGNRTTVHSKLTFLKLEAAGGR